MPIISLSPFVLGQAIAATASGFFLAGTAGASPFPAITAVEGSKLPIAQRSAILGPMFFKNGRPAFIGSVFIGVAGFTTAYLNRPSDISNEHSKALLVGIAALVVALPHTILSMVPVYKGITTIDVAAADVDARWASLMKRLYYGNALRMGIFSIAYTCGLYGLALTKVA